MINFLIFVGILSLISGILFLFSPKTLQNLGRSFNRIVSFEDRMLGLRVGVGVSLLLASILTLFVAYYLVKKYGG